MLNQIHATSKRRFIVAAMLWMGASLLVPTKSLAQVYVLPANGNIIGNIQYAVVRPGDTLATIGLRYNTGGYEMTEANPGVSYSHPKPGMRLVIPSRYVLPDAPRTGVVVNLAEMRMYYYHADGVHVSTYPVGVGQRGWNTPLGKTEIMTKRLHPTWVVPDSILANHEANGKYIPKVKPPGPDNPLGDYAMNIGLNNIVIHGTPYPLAVGVRSSHGCIRMINKDAGELFEMVKIGTPVNIIHQPTKIGRMNDTLYLEAHVPISKEMLYSDSRDVNQLIQKTGDSAGKYNIHWREVEKLQHRASGIPLPIGQIVGPIKSASNENH